MAEVTGVVLGAVSLAATLHGALASYMLLADISSNKPDCQLVLAKLEIERCRLEAFRDSLALDEDPASVSSSIRSTRELLSPTAKELVTKIAKNIQDVLEETKSMAAKYGLVQGSSDANQSPPPSRDAGELSSTELSRTMKKSRRFKWVLKDRDKFQALVDHLKYLNDSLQDLTVSHVVSLQCARALPSLILPHYESLDMLDSFQQETQNRFLASCARFKRRTLMTNICDTIDIGKLKEVSSEQNRIGTMGIFRLHHSSTSSQPVLIEWKPLDPSIRGADRNKVKSRIEQLGALFGHQYNEPEFCLLSCLGIVHDNEETREKPARVGIIYELPISAATALPPTLLDLLRHNRPQNKRPKLGQRFQLALALANSLYLLQSSGWFHKSFCSRNVLLFSSSTAGETDSVALGTPYIIGFGYTRREQDEHLTENPEESDPSDRLYKHPKYLEAGSGFSPMFDIYSLGVVLFEIAIWQPLQYQLGPQNTASEIRETLIRSVSVLGFSVGEVYENVVRRCLTGDFGVDVANGGEWRLTRSVWSYVSQELARCVA